MDKTELMPYLGKRRELSCHDGCQLWGNRVMITPGQTDVLHEAHPGSTRMKRLAHTFVWQPSIDKDIEVKGVVWNARVFNLHLASSLEVGSLALGLGHMLIWQDHSWVTRFSLLMHTENEWKLIHFSSTSTSIIQCLHRIFSTLDLTEVLVTNNSPDFVSKEFDAFLGRNGVNTRLQLTENNVVERMLFMPRDTSLFLGTPFMSRILTEAPQISGFLEISLRQWVHYPFRLPYQMKLFIVILTIFVNDVWNLPKISWMDSWMQHPIHLNTKCFLPD